MLLLHYDLLWNYYYQINVNSTKIDKKSFFVKFKPYVEETRQNIWIKGLILFIYCEANSFHNIQYLL